MLKKMFPAFAAVVLLAACSNSDTSTAGGAAGAGGAGSGAGGSRIARPGSQEDLVASVGDRVFFDTDKSAIAGSSPAARDNGQILDKQAAWLKQYPQNMIQLAGNTDERGTTEYNLALGQRRAMAAQAYLVARGVAQSRITVVSFGKERPTALGSTPDAWAQNRNATTSVR